MCVEVLLSSFLRPSLRATPMGPAVSVLCDVCAHRVAGCCLSSTAGSLVMNHGGGSLLQGKPILYGTVAGSIGEGVGGDSM